MEARHLGTDVGTGASFSLGGHQPGKDKLPRKCPGRFRLTRVRVHGVPAVNWTEQTSSSFFQQSPSTFIQVKEALNEMKPTITGRVQQLLRIINVGETRPQINSQTPSMEDLWVQPLCSGALRDKTASCRVYCQQKFRRTKRGNFLFETLNFRDVHRACAMAPC